MRPPTHRTFILIPLIVAAACEGPGAPASCDPANTLEAYSPFTLERRVCFQDPDGDVLAYEATISDPAVAEVAMVGTTLTVTGKAAGKAEITVTAMDPDGNIGTAAYDVTVAPAWDSGFSVCDGQYVEGEGRVEVLAWIKAHVAIGTIRHELYINGELHGVSRHPGLLAGQAARFGGAWGGPNTDPDIECSHVIDAQPIVTQLDQGGDGWPNGPTKLAG